jgi:hypothetical protein
MKLNLIASVVFGFIATCALAQAPAQQPPTEQPPSQQQPTTQPPSPEAENAVYQAVALYQIKSWQLGGHTYCFRVKGQDADKQFLNKLKPYPVAPESDCTLRNNKDYTTTVIDKRSKKSAVMFGLGNTFWTSPTQAAVQGSYMCGNQCMSGGLYHVVLDGNQWKVTNFEVRLSQ